MTAGRLPRRLVVGLTSAALLGGVVGVVPLLGSAGAAGCLGWTDAAGDASTAQLPNPAGAWGDDNLDLVAATFVTTATTVTTTFTVTKLNEGASDYGDEFHLNFTAGGKDLQIYADRDVDFGPGKLVGDDAGYYNFTDNESGAGKATATYDLAKSTVTITGSLADLSTVAGVPLAGKPVSAVVAGTQNFFMPAAAGVPYDDAATTQVLTLGVDCAGGGTPEPSGPATASPTASASPAPSPTAGPSPTAPATTGGLFDQPRKNCATFKDPTGDADPTETGLDSENALDITQVNLKSPAGSLQVFVKLVDPSAALLDVFDGPVYTATFSVGGKTVAVSAPATGPATATVGGTANGDIKASAKVDAANKNIVFTVPVDGLSKAVGSAVKAGTAITAAKAETAADSLLGPQPADTATGTTPAEKTYAYGDNSCFKPPPGVLEIDADPSGQYGDTTELFAALKDADGSPVQGVKVAAVLSGGRSVTAKTDEDGIAELRIPLLVPAGKKTLAVSYAGDVEVGPAKATKAFTVAAEKTRLKAVALRGAARATLLDDDRPRAHAVVGRYVSFVVGSSRRVVKTGSSGVASLAGLRKGTVVKVTFLPVKGYYLGTPTYTVRVL